jgi:transcriptional regulator with XRE-family HTH domain
MQIEPFYISLGRKIQSIREVKKISQSALGLRLEPKVTRASIANIEAGKQRVLSHTLIQFADILETSLNELTEFEVQESLISEDEVNSNIESELLEGLSPETANELITYLTNKASKR